MLIECLFDKLLTMYIKSIIEAEYVSLMHINITMYLYQNLSFHYTGLIYLINLSDIICI